MQRLSDERTTMTDQEGQEDRQETEPAPNIGTRIGTRRPNFAVNDGHTTASNDNPEGLAWLVEQ